MAEEVQIAQLATTEAIAAERGAAEAAKDQAQASAAAIPALAAAAVSAQDIPGKAATAVAAEAAGVVASSRQAAFLSYTMGA